MVVTYKTSLVPKKYVDRLFEYQIRWSPLQGKMNVFLLMGNDVLCCSNLLSPFHCRHGRSLETFPIHTIGFLRWMYPVLTIT